MNNPWDQVDPQPDVEFGQDGFRSPPRHGLVRDTFHLSGNFSAPPDGMDLSRIFRIAMRNWATVGLLVVFGALAGLFYSKVATPIYKATAVLEMSVRRPKVINNEAVFEDNSMVRDTDVIFNTRFAKFKSPAMERLATKEYFSRYPERSTQRKGLKVGPYTLASMIRDVQWEKDPNANIVYVSYEFSDAELAARLVNVLAFCAGELMVQENQALSDGAVRWLISQVEEQRASLEEVERKLADIRQELQLGSLQQRKDALSNALISVAEEREALISKLASRKTVLEFVSGLKHTDLSLEMLPAGLPKEEQLNELVQTWRLAYEDLQNVATSYTEIHPEYRKAADREARARVRLEQFLDLSSRSVAKEVELLGKQVQQVDTRIEAIKSEVLKLEQLLVAGGQRLQRLERQREAADNAYQGMLRRMEEARLSADENMAYTKVIRNAEVPYKTERPKKIRSIVFGSIFGLLIGCGLVVFLEVWMDKVTSIEELKALGLNVVAAVPAQKRMDSRGELSTIGLRDKFSHVVEIFAGIHALMISDRFKQHTKALLVCSVVPGEGKTVSACNLAISAALNGSRTLLIDGDLRRPQLANIFNLNSEEPSLLEWLSDSANGAVHEELITKGIIDNLDVITSRPLSEINPAELLGRGRLAELLQWAKQNYDRIIIDSPPLGPVGDAQVLANHADSILLVTRIGVSRRRGLRFVLKRFSELGVPVFGCIANDVKMSISGMFSGAEGYGYGIGYESYGRD